MRNEHLVPVNIQDIVNRLNDKSISENELMNVLLRLEAIRDYTSQAIFKYNTSKPVVKKNTRRLP